MEVDAGACAGDAAAAASPACLVVVGMVIAMQ